MSESTEQSSGEAGMTSTLEGVIDQRSDVDYSKIWAPANKVLFIGEHHARPAEEKEFIDSMNTFSSQGASHIGLEMFTSDMQPLLDKYLAETERISATPFKLKMHLKRRWGRYGDEGVKAYWQIVEKAKTLGLGMVAFDLPIEGDDSTPEAMRERNSHWAEVLARVTNNPATRVVALGGGRHFGFKKTDPTANELLHQKGVASTTALLLGGEARFGYAQGESEQARIDSLVEKNKLTTSRFSLDTRNIPGPRNADFYIHLPQVGIPGILKMNFEKTPAK